MGKDGFLLEDLFLKQIRGEDIVMYSTSFNKKDILDGAKKSSQEVLNSAKISRISYRPFDHRFCLSPGLISLFHKQHKNIYLITSMQSDNEREDLFFMTDYLFDGGIFNGAVDIQAFPLYIYNSAEKDGRLNRRVNFRSALVNNIASGLYLTFLDEKEFPDEGEVCFAHSMEVRPEFRQNFSAIDLLDYIYAVLFGRKYGGNTSLFLRKDDLKIPYPEDSVIFWKMAGLGSQLRQVHLLKKVFSYKRHELYPVDGTNIVEGVYFDPRNNSANDQTNVSVNIRGGRTGRVYINSLQYFDEIPSDAWNLSLGGYQPALQWLKERKGRKLSPQEIDTYQQIILSLIDTEQLIKRIVEVS